MKYIKLHTHTNLYNAGQVMSNGQKGKIRKCTNIWKLFEIYKISHISMAKNEMYKYTNIQLWCKIHKIMHTYQTLHLSF